MRTTTEFRIPHNLRIADLVNDLVRQFPLKSNKAETITRTYFDSFDWRLFYKKLQLSVEFHSKGQTLILASQNNPCHQHRLNIENVPVFASDLELFDLRNKLTSILGVRALIPKLTVQYRSYSLHFIGKDQINCANILIENPKLVLQDGRHRLLGKRISLVPVRGCTKLVERIRRYLTNTYSLTSCKKDVFALSLELQNIMPENYGSKLKIEFDEHAKTNDALRNILLTLFHVIKINEDGIARDIDTEFLHDFRVAVRRSRSALTQVKHTFPQDDVETYSKEFSWLGTITGPLRDLHVYVLKFDDYQQILPENVGLQLEPLRDFLEQQKQKQLKHLIRNLESDRYIKLKRDWRKFLSTPLDVKGNETNARKPVKQVADVRIWKMYRRVLKKGNGIHKNSSDTELHKLRICCKKLRYLLEFFECLYPKKKIVSLIGVLKQLQDILGDYNDYHVQIESLKRIEKQMEQEVGIPKATKPAIDMLVDELKSRQQGQRSKFKASYSLFQKKKFQILFQSLFG